MPPHVVIVVLNWNHAEDTLACVASLRALDYGNASIVVCDNASAANDVTRLRDGLAAGPGLREAHADADPGWGQPLALAAGDVVLLHTGANLGFAGGVNRGLRLALAQPAMAYAWVLNNDTLVDPQALDALVRRAAEDPRIGLCGSTLVYEGRREQVQALGGSRYLPWRGRSLAIGAFSATCDVPAGPEAVERQMSYVVGASMLVSRRFLEAVGPMDESYFLYSEEHDWAHRGVRAGFRLGWAPRSVVFHKQGATIGSAPEGGSRLSLFYLYRNKAIFAARHSAARLPVVLCWLAWDALKFLLKGHPAKATAAFGGLLAFPSRGHFGRR
jgi:GT2 family glycosyltransferase